MEDKALFGESDYLETIRERDVIYYTTFPMQSVEDIAWLIREVEHLRSSVRSNQGD
jgi:hypothetical protein